MIAIIVHSTGGQSVTVNTIDQMKTSNFARQMTGGQELSDKQRDQIAHQQKVPFVQTLSISISGVYLFD